MRYIFLISFIFNLLFAIGDVAAIFLLISPSVTANGYGGSAVSDDSQDAYSIYYNPALSEFYEGMNYKLSYSENNWLPNLTDDISFKNTAIMIGKNGIDISNELLFQWSVTYFQTHLDLGQSMFVDEEDNQMGYFNPYYDSKSYNLSFGIKFKYFPLYFSMGRTNKSINLFYIPGNVMSHNLHDWGVRLSLNDVDLSNHLRFSYSIGYSKSNINRNYYFNCFP